MGHGFLGGRGGGDLSLGFARGQEDGDKSGEAAKQ